MQVRDRPLLTDFYSNIEDFTPDRNSSYIYGLSSEQRSAHHSEWQARVPEISFAQIVEQNASDFRVTFGSCDERISLRSNEQLRKFWKNIHRDTVYLDITGLSHHVWAPVLRMGLLMRVHVICIYVEPAKYKFSPTPTEGEIFDLSEAIMGIAPIPGFASLMELGTGDVCFVPLLGFEGTRLAYLLEQVQPYGGKIFPIVGAPGFRPEYPFFAFHGNRSPLAQTRAWRNVRFAIANCPFSVFYLLSDLAAKYHRDRLLVAPIGTKPHALGAVLYALANPARVELVYDHPVRKADRTTGAARLLAYHVYGLPISLRRD